MPIRDELTRNLGSGEVDYLCAENLILSLPKIPSARSLRSVSHRVKLQPLSLS
jgi:hypothetical protein